MSSLQRGKLSALVAKGEVDPPVPFPNTVVKHFSTDNTAPSTGVGRLATARAVLFFFEQESRGSFDPRLLVR